jgi:predicted regulator of Ras-like GTPase activity (Roadblock/LC7/MglB family)
VRPLSPAADNVNWLINSFVQRVPGIREAVVVSSDGLPMAVSAGMDRASADRFAAVSSGLIGLAYGAAGRFGGGAVNEVIVEMERAFIFVSGVSDGSCLRWWPTPTAMSVSWATRWRCWANAAAPC